MPAERAGYTVTMFLVDVSPSMKKTRLVEVPVPGEDGGESTTKMVEMTNLQWSLQFVLLKVQEMIFHGRKTDQCGVVLFGTEETDNTINETNGGYDHVTEFIPIAQPNTGTLAKLQNLQPSTVSGDPLDALIVGVTTQDRYLGNKKSWTRKVVLITDGESPIEVEDWELTVEKMSELNVNLTVVGIDFDDEEFGFKEEDKSTIKAANEKFWKQLTEAMPEGRGVVGTCAFALQECVRPDVKMTKSALMGSILRLGDVEGKGGRSRQEEALEIVIKISKCTARARPATMKKFAKRHEENHQDDDDEGGNDVYAQLRGQTEYYVQNPDGDDEGITDEGDAVDADGDGAGPSSGRQAEDSRVKVDKEQLVKGFRYGSTYAPCPDGEFPRLETKKGIDICGFFSAENIPRPLFMGELSYVWADTASGREQAAFSSLVRAMLARDSTAIARYVSRDGMDAKMGLLIPRSWQNDEGNLCECLLWVQMPFADDVRRYAFPSLMSITNKKGERITKHPFIPTPEQLDTMDDFVDAMDLLEAGDKDEEGKRMPWFDPRLSYNPAIHRVKQALFHAAIVPDLLENPLPPPHPEVVKYLEPPRRVLKRAAEAAEQCKRAMAVKEVPRKITRTKKDGHVAAQDEEDMLLLDVMPTKPKSPVKGSQAPAPSPTLVDSDAKGKGKSKQEAMDVDSDTEDSDTDIATLNKQKAPQKASPTPARSRSPAEYQSSKQREPGRIVSTSSPLRDFRANLKRGDIVTKAVEDLAWAVNDIIMRPFAGRRHQEMRECLVEMREVCLKEDEIDAWNTFLKDLKKSCLSSSGIRNVEFWEMIRENRDRLGLITSEEASKLGGVSEISSKEAQKFMQS